MLLLLALIACTTSTPDDTTVAAPRDTGPFYAADAECGDRVVSDALIRTPYVQRVTTDAAVIAWGPAAPQADAQLVGTLHWGLDATVASSGTASQQTIAGDGADIQLMHVELSGLEAGTEYCYAIDVDGTSLASGMKFRTAPASDQAPVTFTVIGDFGKANETQAAVRDRMKEHIDDIDLHLTVGDNAYGSGQWDEFQRNVFAMYPELWSRAPVFPTAGNHDWNDDYGLDAYVANFFLPDNAGREDDREIYWSTDWGPLHIVGLDSEKKLLQLTPDDPDDGDMLDWLRADIQASDKPWTIVLWHHPPYSEDPERAGDPVVRLGLMPVLQELDVDVAFMGHDHFYVRYHPLVDEAIAQAGDARAVHYVMTGGGGAEVRDMEDPPDDDRVAYRQSVNQFAYVRADGCTFALQSIDLDGNVIDEMTLSKCE